MKQTIQLDQQQTKAITSDGSTAIIAGPGAGKTRVLLSKAQYESQKGNKALCLTFTRSAAEEIRERAPKVRASTIHSLCFHRLGYFPGDHETLLDEFLHLKRKPKFDIVLVDEFQDLTSKELEVILSVCKKDLFLVGDNNQAIFGYCDAEGFQIPKSKIRKIYLSNNYRSNKKVIERLEKLNLRQLVSVNTKTGNKGVEGTAILFRTNHHLDMVAMTLKELGYSFTIRKRGLAYPGEVISGTIGSPDGMVLCTGHCSKGKEWRKVIAFDWGEREREKNLYYVMIARASQEFHLVNNITGLLPILTPQKNS